MTSGSATDARPCPVCDGEERLALLPALRLPVHCHLRCRTREEALAASCGELRLVQCSRCGHVHNERFDGARMGYASGYEHSLSASAVFRAYAERLARGLVERHGVRGKTVLEIGCGKGEFLRRLCVLGDNRGVGFEPSAAHEPPADEPFRLVASGYDERGAGVGADLVVCRHVLEHLERPGELLAQVRRHLGRRSAVVYFEVPDGAWTLERGGLWDVLYEHKSYFTAGSLAHLFGRAGFRVTALRSEYGGQFLALEAVPEPGEGERAPQPPPRPPASPERLAALASGFRTSWERRVEHWRRRLAALAAAGTRVALWGAGSKGVTFLNVLGESAAAIERVVDSQPAKQGAHVPGTGHPIVAPAALAAAPPGLVLAMNPLYREEIAGQLAALGVEVGLEVV